MTKRIVKTFILTTIIVMLLIIALLLIYIMKSKDVDEQTLDVNARPAAKSEKTSILNKALTDAENEEVLRGVIFIGDGEDKSLISTAYVVNFDRQKNKINFYNFPGDMIFEISNELHKDISTSLADIPQVLKMSHLYKYNKNKQGLKAGMLMLEDYLEAGLSHYLFLSKEAAEKIFYFNEEGDSTFLQSFVNEVINGSDKNKSDFVAAIYNDKFTDIKKKAYVKLLTKLSDVKNINFTSLKGDRFDNGVVIKKEILSQALSAENE